MMHLLRTTPTAVQTAAVPRGNNTPSHDSVQQIIGLLTDRNNADFRIAATVNNQPGLVRQRYQRFTGDTRALSTSRLISRLQDMERKGQSVLVLKILSVKWARGKGDALDIAVQSLGSEAAAKISDPSTGFAKNLPFPDNDLSGGSNDNPTNTDAETGGGSGWDWTAFWGSLPGIVSAVTGNVPNTPGTGTNQPPTTGTTNWLTVGLVLLGITAVVVVIAMIAKKAK